MEILPVSTRILRKGDDLAGLLANAASWEDGDIVAVSSKAVATVEGAVINLKTLKITDEAKELARISGRSPAFRQAILEETHRLNGTVTGPCPQAVLTEVRPEGLEGTLLVPNAALRFKPANGDQPKKDATGNGSGQKPKDEKSGRPRDGYAGKVYVLKNGEPVAVSVSLGITDNRSTEIVGGELKAGDQILVGAAQAANGASSSAAPRMRMF